MQAEENEPTAPYVCRVRADMASPTNQACSLGDLGEEHITQDTRNVMKREGGGRSKTSDVLAGEQGDGTRSRYRYASVKGVSSFDILRILPIPIFHESANI